MPRTLRFFAMLLVCMIQLAVIPDVAAKGQVMDSWQACPPDGYVRVPAPKGNRDDYPVKNDRGRFTYCIDGHDKQLMTGMMCNKWGTALQYIKARLGRTDVAYAGMGVRDWSSADLYLFYCLAPTAVE